MQPKQSDPTKGFSLRYTTTLAAAAATLSQPLPYMGGSPMTPTSPVQQAPTPSAPTSYVDEKYLAKSLEAHELKVDLKINERFAEILSQLASLKGGIDSLNGKFGPIEQKIDAKPGMWKILGAAGGAVVAGLTVTFAVLAFAGDRFDGGMSASGALAEQQRETDAKYDCLMARFSDPQAVCK
jgi:hypothetical protein